MATVEIQYNVYSEENLHVSLDVEQDDLAFVQETLKHVEWLAWTHNVHIRQNPDHVENTYIEAFYWFNEPLVMREIAKALTNCFRCFSGIPREQEFKEEQR